MKANANHLEKKLHSFSAKKFSENFIHSASNGYEDNDPKIENLKKRQGKNFKLHFHCISGDFQLRTFFLPAARNPAADLGRHQPGNDI